MENVSIKVNLAVLEHALMKTESGTKCIVIPIEKNHLFESEKGNVYMDLIAFPVKNPTKDQTHLVKQSLPKELRSKDQPIVGNLKLWGENDSRQEAAPNNSAPGKVADGVKDLPF